jgi:hypothetical protein
LNESVHLPLRDRLGILFFVIVWDVPRWQAATFSFRP